MAKKQAPLKQTSESLFDNVELPNVGVAVDVSQFEANARRGISVAAVLSLIFGALGFLSLLHLGFLACSVFALLCAIFAFYSIARSGATLGGKKIAELGLFLAIASGVAGPYSAYLYEKDFNRQADEFIHTWFENVKAGRPELAMMASDPFWRRTMLVNEDEVKNYWRGKFDGEEETHFSAHTYLCNPTLLTISHLGDRAKLSYYCTNETLLTDSTEQTSRVYAVTCEPTEEGGKKQTFFLTFNVERVMNSTPQDGRLVGWMMLGDSFIPLDIGDDGRPILPK
ncbi:MAG: hypothetical protein ACOX0A_09555 [Thermoguttaceae bacterium]|jgi:hypothetical protein